MAKTGRYMYNERQPQQQTTTITAKQASKARQRRHHSETHLSALNNVFDFFQSLVVFVNFCNKNTYKKGRYKRTKELLCFYDNVQCALRVTAHANHFN